jgi:hypothetical protein
MELWRTGDRQKVIFDTLVVDHAKFVGANGSVIFDAVVVFTGEPCRASGRNFSSDNTVTGNKVTAIRTNWVLRLVREGTLVAGARTRVLTGGVALPVRLARATLVAVAISVPEVVATGTNRLEYLLYLALAIDRFHFALIASQLCPVYATTIHQA